MQPRILALFALLIITPSLRAEPALVVTLSSVADRVRSQNPDLAAARLRIDEAVGRMKQSGRLTNPTLDTSFEHNSRFREGRLEVGFTQRFPVTNRLSLEKTVSVTELKASEAEVREVERILIAEARQTIIKVLAIRQRRELVSQQTTLSKEFSTFLSDAAGRGEGSPLDAGQAKLEAAALAVEMRQIDATEAATVGELKPLLGMLPSTQLNVSGVLPMPVIPKPDGNSYPSRRPDLQAATLDAVAAAQNVDLEKSKKYDDLEGGIFAAGERSEDAPDGYDNEAIVGFRLKIPLPLWNKNEGAIEAAQATKVRKEKEAIALGRSIRLESATARAEMEEWSKLVVELNDVLLPLADEQFAAADKAFRSGQGEIQTVFRNREKRQQLAASKLDALREFHLARVRYEAALGKP